MDCMNINNGAKVVLVFFSKKLPSWSHFIFFALLLLINTEEIDSQTSSQQNPVMTFIPSVEPEQLRNVMPGSWQSLQRLTAAEEQAFITSHSQVITEIGRFVMREVGLWWGNALYYFIYKQQFSSDIFYRIVVVNNYSPDFMSPAIEFAQALVFQGELLAQSLYGHIVGNDLFGLIRHFRSLDIITDSNGALGILATRMEVRNIYDWVDDPADWHTTSPRRNGQLFGTGVTGEFFPLNNAPLRKGRRSFGIRASDILVDPIVPLRHGLQSAFDGNPLTAYIANTEYSFFDIGVIYLDVPTKKLALINGFTADSATYNNYNRVQFVATIRSFADRYFHITEMNDNTFSWQIIESLVSSLAVQGIFEGMRYNFTAISGFNLYFEGYGWLFGDINE